MPIDPDHPPESFRDHLSSVDVDGRRTWLYVDWNGGSWRRRRVALSWVLVLVNLGVPWLTINGKEALRINFQDQHLTLLGTDFLPSDIPIFFIFALLGVLLTLLSVALLGRVFCGWLCPHNVFLETVFRPLEQFLEGPAHRRERQDRDPTTGLSLRKTLKWLGYIVFCGAMANAGVVMFLGTDVFLWGAVINPLASPGGTVFFCGLFAACLFNFSWFREQTCTLVCPYGRLQAGMLDDESLIVAYDHHRGEPRGKPGKTPGDCVDCERFIQVCPTGIDIQNGTQLECIHCTDCIDACDTIMTKLKRPRGLIRYTSEKELAGGKRRWLRPRVLL
jgi:cytochrome c oxidase accessory protein FixG